ncbi:M56 family metallopeptidase [Cyclobacterium sp. 1_MG-2023]|uniref:M56 family metallopeptidase n=1 Tax=Cyclobacterium sp. 1_MG-2023 TaxID=3062681 RepID=UPI0026E199B0|nr:M56 family metallopeptidase [Cyclobacterium sp. 1_MG-2023]MDO6436972.1 M56 family metallopeptidase [Cyclobacterium sp. 1_MG-2023]
MFNRVYLLVTPFLAVAFSLIEIPVSFETPSISLENTAFLKALEFDSQKEIAGAYGLPEVTVTGSRLPTLWDIKDYLIFGYLVVVLLLFARFYWQYLQLKEILRKGWYQTSYILKEKYFKVPNFGLTPVFSYFDKVFWDDSLQLSNKEKKQILNHEIEHVKQKHSYDVIIYQILSNVFWFNPIIHLMNRALVDLHEFQADARVIKDVELKDSYPKLVARMAFAGLDLPLGSNFVSSTTLRRIRMMKANKKTNWFKVAMLVPLTVLVFGLISMKSNNSIISFNNYSTLPVSFLKNQIEAFQDSIAVGIKLKNIKNPTHYESIGKLHQESLNVQVGELSYEFTGIKNQQEYIKVLNLVETLRPNSKLNKKYENAYSYQLADQKPEPKVGWNAWEEYLRSQIPARLIDGIQIDGDWVALEFVIDKEANIVNASIKKSLGEEVDQLLLTALTNGNSPTWIPGKKDGETVAVVVNTNIKLKKSNNIKTTQNEELSRQGLNNNSKTFPENRGLSFNDDLKSGAITLGAPFKTHLIENLVFPEDNIAKGLSGTTIVILKTDSSGNIEGVSFSQRIDGSFEKEILEVLSDSPNLQPILQKNEYQLHLPISFKINGAGSSTIVPSLNNDYGDVIQINGNSTQKNPITANIEIPVQIIKEGLISFNGVLMPINSGLSRLIKAYTSFNSVDHESIFVNFSAGKDIKMGEVQNVQAALREVGINKIVFKAATSQILKSAKSPLYIIDGIVHDSPSIPNFPKTENIKTISVVNPNQLIVHGEKAKNGAIVITTE